MQRVNSAGTAQWTTNGVTLCSAAGEQVCQEIVSDGPGSAIVVWEDFRSGTNYEVYIRRVGGTGPVGPAGGVASLGPHVLHFPQVVPDGSGGAIVSWADARSGQNDVFAQQLSAGALQ